MRTLYIDCGMGAAGDMLTAALLELIPDREAFVKEFNALGIPGVSMHMDKSVKCGITGTHVSILVDGEEEGEEHHHEHEHDHMHCHEHDSSHGHCHSHEHDHEYHHHHGLHDIEHIVNDHLRLSGKIKNDIMSVFSLIAEAESHVHGVPMTDIHFHEVGTMDAVADITAVSMLMDRIAPDEVVVSPIHVGYGHVHCAHGILPVPAPATAYILSGLPIYAGSIEGELCTPTGAALLKHFATSFGQMPMMSIKSIGYGMGKKDFEAANCVRAMLGERSGSSDSVIGLSCNIDDMTGEEIGFAMDMLFRAGARDVYTIPIGMKKSRPGVMLSVICSESDLDSIVRTIFRYTTTIGVRKTNYDRFVLERRSSESDTDYGKAKIKVSEGYGVKRIKAEYDDLERIAKDNGLTLREAGDMIRKKNQNTF